MRKQENVVLWPVYFDNSKTRREGRKVPKNVAVSNPRLKELHKAAEVLGFSVKLEVDAAHPAIPWMKTGRMWVKKDKSKMKTIARIAKELLKIRQKEKK